MFFFTEILGHNYSMSTSDTLVQIYLGQNSDDEYIDFTDQKSVPEYFCRETGMSAGEICAAFKEAHKRKVINVVQAGEEGLEHLFLPKGLIEEYKQALR